MIKPCDIVFIMHNDSRLSRAIAWFMMSRWSHSAIVAGKFREKTILIETSDFQVMRGDMDRYAADPECSYEVLRHPGLDRKECDAILDGSESTLYRIYGYTQLISFGVRRLLSRVGIKISNFFRHGLVCCAVPLYGYKESSVLGMRGIDPESIDTQELYDLCIASGFKVAEKKVRGEIVNLNKERD